MIERIRYHPMRLPIIILMLLFSGVCNLVSAQNHLKLTSTQKTIFGNQGIYANTYVTYFDTSGKVIREVAHPFDSIKRRVEIHTYDSLGRLSRTEYFAHKSESSKTYRYDDHNELIMSKSYNKHQLGYDSVVNQYDSSGRLIGIDWFRAHRYREHQSHQVKRFYTTPPNKPEKFEIEEKELETILEWYDENANQILSLRYENGLIQEVQTHAYKKGRLISHTRKTIFYKYIAEVEESDSMTDQVDRTKLYRYKYKYDKDGRLVIEKTHIRNNFFKRTSFQTRYWYNGFGDLVYRERKGENGRVTQTIYVNTYSRT